MDFSSSLTSMPSSLRICTWITWSGALAALPTLGRSIMLGAISGAVTMKMISSTSMTSMNGTMLISLIVRRPRPRWAIVGMSVPRGGVRAQVALQDVRELLDEGLEAVGDTVDVACEAVVRDHGGDRGEQADGRGDERLRDAGRNSREGHGLQRAQADE